MSGRREEQALRIMEALSGVDEELLERCEGLQPAGEPAKPKGVSRAGRGGFRRLAGRYGGLCAAAVCLAVICAAWWSAEIPRSGGLKQEEALPEGAQDNMQEGGSPESWEEQYPGEEQSQSRGDGEQEGAVWEPAASDGEGTEGSLPPVPLEEKETAVCFSGENETEGALQEMTESDQADLRTENDCAIPGNRPEEFSGNADAPVSWEDACGMAGIEERFPVYPPEEYVLCSATVSGEDGGPVLQYIWGDGEHTLCLKLAGKDSAWHGDGTLPVLNPADWTDSLPEPGGDGAVRFAVALEDGARLEYEGWLTEEELETLLGGLADS